jgi:hypothetical protein
MTAYGPTYAVRSASSGLTVTSEPSSAGQVSSGGKRQETSSGDQTAHGIKVNTERLSRQCQSAAAEATTVSAPRNDNKQTLWPESASELYRPSDNRLSAKLMPTFADRGVSGSQRGRSSMAVISVF